MIGKLKGLIDSYGEDYVILDVQGVGYQVYCASRTLQALPSPGEAAVLSIETYVREHLWPSMTAPRFIVPPEPEYSVARGLSTLAGQAHAHTEQDQENK